MAALLGVFAYNVLLLPFCLMTATALFGCFALVLAMDLDDLTAHHSWALPWRSVTVFLVLGAAAVTVRGCRTSWPRGSLGRRRAWRSTTPRSAMPWTWGSSGR